MFDLFTIGFTSPAEKRWLRLVAALSRETVEVLVDVRHSPCASDPDPNTKSHYGPRQWNLQLPPTGIASGLKAVGISYLWLVELGNPQKRDPRMQILRHQLAQPGGWPVHRGLEVLRELVIQQGKRCCLLCACEDYATCHRSVIADAFCKAASPAHVKVTDLTKDPTSLHRTDFCRNDS